MSSVSRDVVIIGGGPAGSTSASYLARMGYDVTVFERARFPREHVGESMLPFCWNIFNDLGVLEDMEARWVRKPGVRFLHTDDATATAWCFADHIFDASSLSFQVIRSEFDEVLLDHSASLGAEVRMETKVVDVDVDQPDGGVRLKAVGPDGKELTYDARFVIDASGRDTFLANRMQTKTAHEELARTALSCSDWRGAKFVEGLEDGLIHIVYTGGEKQGWIWVIPLGTDRVSVGVVMNTAYYLAQRKVLQAKGHKDWQLALYLQEIQSSRYPREILANAEMGRPLLYNGDYSYFCHEKWGDNFALVGDASAFIDPIFSTGVYLALNSARLLAEATDVRLREGVEEGRSVFTRAYESIVGAYDLIDKLIRLFYTPEAINFAQLGSAEAAFEDREHYKNALAVYHFLIAGDFFEQYERYSSFIDALRDPKTFRRYKKYVLERPSLNAARCAVEYDQIFHPDTLLVHEERRRASQI
jgi:flavin-dependent dehydrogenase